MNIVNNKYKGVVLAGGSGTRLYPVTKVVSKQLLPIYNKPMIYYPLSTLINASIKEILIITTEEDQHLFKRLLGDGSQWDVNFEYAVQKEPEGIAQSLIIAKNWLGASPVILILGDNLFFGPNLFSLINNSVEENVGATLFSFKVVDPERYGVVEFDKSLSVLSLEEKPKDPKSNWIVTGLYIYNNNVVKYAEELRKSERGEYEITDLNKMYLKENNLKVVLMNDEYSWLDTGTHETLIEASNFVKNIEDNSEEKVVNLNII